MFGKHNEVERETSSIRWDNSGKKDFGRTAGALRWKRAMVVGGLGIAIIASGLAAAAPAFAGACSKTGGDSNRLMWTGSGYACAYVASSGNKSIGQAKTHNWSSSTAKGYQKHYTCHGQTGGVTVTFLYADSGGANAGGGITYTAFNTSSGTRHWNAAVLWGTSNIASDQYVHNCTTDYPIAANIFYKSQIDLFGDNKTIPKGTSAAYPVKVTAPDGGGPANGTVVLFRQIDPEKKNTPGQNCQGASTNSTAVETQDQPIGTATLAKDGSGATLQSSPNLPPGKYKVYALYKGWPVTDKGLPAHCLPAPQGSGLTPAVLETSMSLTVE